MGVMKTFWEEWRDAAEEERRDLDPLDCEDRCCEDEMECWDAEEEAFDGE